MVTMDVTFPSPCFGAPGLLGTTHHESLVEAIEALDPFQDVDRCDECGENLPLHAVDSDLQCASVCDGCDYGGES